MNKMIDPTNFTTRKALQAEYCERNPRNPFAGAIMSEQEQIIEDRHGEPIGRRMLRTWYKRGNPFHLVAQQYGDGPVIFDAAPAAPPQQRKEGWSIARRLLPWI